MIADRESARGELGDQAAQGEVPLGNPVPQPGLMLAPDRLGLVPAHLARRHTPRLPEPPHPVDRRARHDPKPRRRFMPRQTALNNRGNDPLTQIH